MAIENPCLGLRKCSESGPQGELKPILVQRMKPANIPEFGRHFSDEAASQALESLTSPLISDRSATWIGLLRHLL